MYDICTIIDREIFLISRFTQLLLDEQECLKQATPELLPKISDQKISLIDELNQLEIKRNSLLGQSSTNNKQLAMTNWLTQNDHQGTATVNWQKLLKMAKEAKTLHEVNSKLVTLHLSTISVALAVLNNQEGAKSLYSNKGQAAHLTGSRIVDSA